MWIVIKVVSAGAVPVIGCAVGPFNTEAEAQSYGDAASIGSLGYEKWAVKKLLREKRIK